MFILTCRPWEGRANGSCGEAPALIFWPCHGVWLTLPSASSELCHSHSVWLF